MSLSIAAHGNRAGLPVVRFAMSPFDEAHPLPRRALAALGLSVAPALVAHDFVRSRATTLEWLMLLSPIVAAATPLAVGPFAQVIARGFAIFYAVIGVFTWLHDPRGGSEIVAISIGACVALVALRGSLHTAGARRTFAPVVARTPFLFACVALVATSPMLALTSLETLHHHHRRAGLVSAALLSMALCAAWGVVRMRAWGVFLGALVAFGGAIAVASAQSETGRAVLGYWWDAYEMRASVASWALASIAGALLVAPVVWARTRRQSVA